MESKITRWNTDIEQQVSVFLKQVNKIVILSKFSKIDRSDPEKTLLKATQVNAWSGLLLTNGEKISDLCADLEKVQVQQQELDNELDKVASQQAELEG